jgi:carnitine 3-dehydrogenase
MEHVLPERVAVVGGGAIGSGWAAHFLRMGLDVVAFDPAPGAEDAMRDAVARTWPVLLELGVRDGAAPERLRFASSVAEAVADADVVQESAPERLETKVRLFAEMDEAAAPSTLLVSSTSGFLMTDIQRDCRHPERTVVGHPFQPPYLIPLVEVVGGERTSPEAVDRAAAFYAAQGKEVVKLRREIPGFVANRLQEAVWREMLHMIDTGEATFEEVDRAIVHGPGLRWALMGPGLVYHLAGGAGGMTHRLDHFRPEVTAAWCRMEAPPLTDALRSALIDGADHAAAGRSIAELERERDQAILALLRSRRPL